MSTRSAIIEKCTDGTFRGIYCHYDGYRNWVGKILLEHYTDPAKVTQLIDLGSLSSLGKHVVPSGKTHSWNTPEDEVTVAYARDRGDRDGAFVTGATIAAVARRIDNNGFVYDFDGATWRCNGELFTGDEDD